MGAAAKRLAKWKAARHNAEASGSGNPLADDAEASSNGKGPAGDEDVVVLSVDDDDA